ncbi:ATP synthase subunit I [Desulfonatronospira sp.]|uniref:ATP synthase subunit I n=1 Tax=Desulfonatronospira sp. TaxID=1962951 RepID=UPI0025C2040C|nr:ATP synthase subunit I [Desulfonatronospira sp.]
MNSLVENFLYKRGFVLPRVRFLVRNQFYLSVLGLLVFIIFFPVSWIVGFGIGALLGSLNFYFMARLAQELVYIAKGAATPLLFSFYVRLILTGLVLYVAIVYWNANVFALLLGLSVILLNVLVFGITLVGQKFKEA